MTPRLRAILLFAAAAVLFTVPALMKDLWRPDEPRYAEVAREMMAAGDYLVPHVNGEVYREKPPLLFWLIALASWPGGEVTAFTARVPSILAALATLGLTFDLTRRMFGDRAALWSGIVLATTYRFWWQSNIGQIDMLLTACTTLALYSLWRLHEGRNAYWSLGVCAGAALGLLAKGPPALLVVGLGAVAFAWRDRELRGRLGLWAALPLALIPVSVWFLLARSAAGAEVSSEVTGTFSRQIFSRITEGVSHPHPPWYYLAGFIFEWFPWSLFAPWVMLHAWCTRRDGPAVRLLLAWTIPALVFFHLSVEKRNVYLLPLFPTIAIMTARGVLSLVEERRTAPLIGTAILGVPIAAAMAELPLLLPRLPVDMRWDSRLDPIALVGLVALLATVCTIRTRAWLRWPTAIAGIAASTYLAVGTGGFQLANESKSAEEFCESIRQIPAPQRPAIYDLGPLREEYVFYMATNHHLVLIDPGANVLAAIKGNPEGRAKDIRHAFEDACESPELDSFTRPCDADRAGLERARDGALGEVGLTPREAQAYRESVNAEVDALVDRLHGPEPAVLLVRVNDWRWVLSFAGDTSFLTVAEHEHVGEHEMLLLANPAALRLIRHA